MQVYSIIQWGVWVCELVCGGGVGGGHQIVDYWTFVSDHKINYSSVNISLINNVNSISPQNIIISSC